MSKLHHPAASHRRPVNNRNRLTWAVVTVAGVMALANIGVRISQSDAQTEIAAAIPQVTLASAGQAANRIAVDTSQLHLGSDVVVPVEITNAGQKSLNGVLASLASAAPGVQLKVEAVSPVAPNASAQYRLRFHATTRDASQPKQLVVALTPET